MKYGIIGAGNAGKACCAYLQQQGCPVLLWNRTPARLQPIAQKGLLSTGAVEGSFPVPVTDSLARLAAECDVLVFCTLAQGHRSAAEQLKGHLRNNQILLVTNSCWGAVELDLVLGQEAAEKQVLIGETSGQIFLCSSPAPEAVHVKTIKRSMDTACTDPAKTAALISRLAPQWPMLTAASSVLETTLSALNPVCHGPYGLFNLTRIENGEEHPMFTLGMSPTVSRYVQRIDAERVQVAAACGAPIRGALEQFNTVWGGERDSLYEVFQNTTAYANTPGPVTLQHRYFTEDLPYGLVPLVRLGRKLGVATPALESMLTLLGIALEQDWLLQGPAVEQLDCSRYLP